MVRIITYNSDGSYWVYESKPRTGKRLFSSRFALIGRIRLLESAARRYRLLSGIEDDAMLNCALHDGSFAVTPGNTPGLSWQDYDRKCWKRLRDWKLKLPFADKSFWMSMACSWINDTAPRGGFFVRHVHFLHTFG